MGRGHWHPNSCKVCGRSVEEVGHISQAGLCPEHGEERELANLRELRARSGPFFRHWRRQLAASVGGVLREDLATGDTDS